MSGIDLRLTGLVELRAGSEGKRPAFSMLAYTGAPMVVSGIGPVVIELSGLKASRDRIPILFDHDATKIVGFADRVTIDARGVHLAGTITGGSDADSIVGHARNGFEWQASVGCSIGRREYLASGAKAVVNGRTVVGPMLIARQSTLLEVSFVAVGADQTTVVNVAARHQGVGHMSFAEWVASKGFEVATLDDAQIGTLRAAYDAEHAAATPAPTEAEIQARAERDRRGRLEDIAEHAIRDAPTLHDAILAARDRAVIDNIDPSRFETDMLRMQLRHAQDGAHAMRATGGFGIHAARGPALSGSDQLMAATLMLGGHAELVAATYGDRATSYRPSGWAELCAMALQTDHRPVPQNRSDLIRAGFSTASLPNALGGTVNKVALETFVDASSNWRALARIVSASDFKQGKAVRLNVGGGGLQKVGPGGEIKHGALTDDAFDFRVETYARMFALTRQDIINDDLSILADLPMVLGNEAARTVADTFFEVLVAGGATHFTSGRGNRITDELDVDALALATRTLRTMRDDDGRIVGMVPTTLLVPAALEHDARAILNSTELARDQSTDRQTTANPVNATLALVVEPRLDDASESDWYVFARANQGAMLVAFLDGRQGPVVESSDADFNTLGVQWRAYMDFGVSLGEYRAAVKADVTPYDA